MGVFLLNISIDTPDPNPDYIPEDLSINDQESIVELVVEQFLGFEDAFKEYDDHDAEGQHFKKHLKIDLAVYQRLQNESAILAALINKQKFGFCRNRLSDGFTEISSPPPKV